MRFIIVAALFAVAFAAPTQSDLSVDINRLKEQAQTEIKKLLAEGKGVLAKEIQVIEDEIIKVENKLKQTKPEGELGKLTISALESILSALEKKLDNEIKKLNNAGTFYDDSLRQALEKDAAKLKKLAEETAAKLQKEGKLVLAKEIKIIEDEIVKAEGELKKVNPQTELGKLALSALKSVLSGLEKKLDNEIKKLGGAFYESTKDELAKDAEKLKKLAQDTIRELEKEGKSVLAKEIKIVEDEIVKVENKLKTLKPEGELGKLALSALESILSGLEKKLDNEIKKLGGK